MEGAVTLYFPPNYSYSTLLSAATLSTLGSIKEGMENGELLETNDKVLALLFLEKSYNLKPIYPGDEMGFTDERSVVSNGGEKNYGLVVGIIVMVLILLACCVGGLYYKRRSDRELAFEREQRARLVEQLSAKTVASANSQSRNAREESEDNGTTTSEDDDNGTTTSEDDNGTTTSEENSTTSGSKETTTDSDQEDTSSYSSDSDAVYEDDDDDFDATGYGNLYKKKKKRVKKAKNNIVIGGGGDEASVATGATGATGLHSESSQRTVKMKNVVLPSILDVNINMR